MYQGHEYALKYEAEIVWLVDDLENYPWVREGCTDFYHPKKIATSRLTEIECGDKLIGYGVLRNDTPKDFIDPEHGHKHYWRRIFTVRDGDYQAYEGSGSYPSEAVDPLTLKVGVKGLSPKQKSQIAIRIPVPLLRKMIVCSKKTGMNQTDIVTTALTKYLNLEDEMTSRQRLDALEKRVGKLENND
jgi:predicted DNA-binding protein